MTKRIIFPVVIILLSACTRKLDIKPDQSSIVPQTVADFQALMDVADILNAYLPSYGEAGADNYYITDAIYNGLALNGDRNAYIWGKDIFSTNENVLDWSNGYVRVNYCNLVLEGLEKLTTDRGSAAYNNVRGTALFFRALSFYSLAGEFSKPYDSTTAATDPGIPLRVKSDVEIIYQRATVKATYELVLSDLAVAAELLPDITTFKTRPSKAAVYGLLARIHLDLKNYQEALKYANLSLGIYHNLLDYNTLDPGSSLPFDKFNDDVLFYAKLIGNGLIRTATMIVDSTLYRQYEDNDLRKVLFFRNGTGGTKLFKGTYSGNNTQYFGGIGVDEMYIVRAECYARTGDIVHAMEDLNTLLRTRWKAGTYTDMTAVDADDALKKVLTERRKELLFRGLRWVDLRRLNKDPRFAKTLIRIVNGTVYKLPPNDVRYVYPIPADEIRYSGIEQNVR